MCLGRVREKRTLAPAPSGLLVHLDRGCPEGPLGGAGGRGASGPSSALTDKVTDLFSLTDKVTDLFFGSEGATFPCK
jgi:hypothetical protein